MAGQSWKMGITTIIMGMTTIIMNMTIMNMTIITTTPMICTMVMERQGFPFQA